jgi:porin
MKLSALPLIGVLSVVALSGAGGGTEVSGPTKLAERGVEFGLTYIGEVFGNVSGGRRRGVVEDGLLFVSLDVDLGKVMAWRGGRVHADVYETHGASGTTRNVGDLGYFSNIDYPDGYRLGELWFEQGFLDDRLSVRVGQLALDAEFLVTSTAVLFINASFGPANALVLNMPAPYYGFSGLGARVKFRTTRDLYVQVAAYDGNPGTAASPDFSPDAAVSTEFNHFGTHWALRDAEGILFVAEVGKHLNQPESGTPKGGPRGLAASYKAGVFFHTDTFSDVRDQTLLATGSSLAPAAVRSVEGNYGVYAVVDQELWREKGSDTDGLSSFTRAVLVPTGRNAVDFSVEAGLVYHGLLQKDGADALGIGCAWINASNSVRGAVRGANRADRLGLIEPDYEAIFELTYRWQIASWWTIQPDVQWILHPGGSRAIDDALVLGLRSTIAF